MNLYHFLPTESEDLQGVIYYLHNALSQIALSMTVTQDQIDNYINQSHIRYEEIDFSDTTGTVGDVIPKGAFIEAISVNIQAFTGASTVLKIGDADDESAFGEVTSEDMQQTHRTFVTTAPLTGKALAKNTQALFKLEGAPSAGTCHIAIICRATR